ncbi:MAG: SpoIIE family protein phosphatase, partial [bacterium]
DNGFVIETLKGVTKSLEGTRIQIDDYPAAPAFLNDLPAGPWRAFLQKNGMELVIPILHDEKKLGLICFGKKIVGKNLADSELEYLHSLSNIAATAIQNGLIFEELNDVNRQLDKRVQELNTLFEIGKELNSTLQIDKVLNLLAYSIMGEMMVQRLLIFLVDEDDVTLSLNKGFQSDSDLKLANSRKFQRQLLKLEEPVLADEAPDLEEALNDLDISAVIPMRIQKQTKGIIGLGKKITNLGFTNDELNFLTTLGNLSMISIENARLFEETLEKQRLEKELQVAREIQQQLLPDACPVIENFDIAAMNLSSREVGGDYYDCIKLDEEKYAITIADVSGKGAPAALLMANLQASLHALVNTDLNISEITSRINNLIHRNTGYDKFITFFFGILNVKEKTFTCVNAGHNPPYLFHKDRSFDLLEEGGLILGMMPNMPYSFQKVQLEPGDCIVMFTDGVSEAMNGKEEEFEEKRIEECVVKNFDCSAEGIMQNLLASVKEFSKGQPQADDITIMTIKVS